MNCLHALEAELSERKIGSDSSIQCLLTLLLICMIRELNNQPEKNRSAVRNPVSQQREETIDNYFASHYRQDIQARDLAEHIGITTRQLSRIMHKRYGCTFRQHLLEIRLYHARRQLTDTEDTVLQIANDCGFTCQGAFSTAFRKATGCTPSQYRRNT